MWQIQSRAGEDHKGDVGFDDTILQKDLAIDQSLPPCISSLRVFVFNRFMDVSRERARAGASMGELTYQNSVLRALGLLCIDAVSAGSDDAAAPHLAALNRDPNAFDAVIVDTYSLESLLAATGPGVRCKLLVLDVWGTPKAQNWRNLHLRQFVLPLSMGPGLRSSPNTVVGYVVDAEDTRDVSKRQQGYIWGKEARYFANHRPLLEALARESAVVVAARPEATPLLPPGVTNLGILSSAERTRVLRESKYMLGLGDPVLGMSPYEAMAAGCVYLDAQFDAPRQLAQNRDVQLSSQHEFALRAGEPHAVAVRLGDIGAVVDAARKALAFRGTAGKSGVDKAPYVPPGFDIRSVAAKLEEVVGLDFCGGAAPAPADADMQGVSTTPGDTQPMRPMPRRPGSFTRRLSAAR